jgi:thiol:disulfide interchange protein
MSDVKIPKNLECKNCKKQRFYVRYNEIQDYANSPIELDIYAIDCISCKTTTYILPEWWHPEAIQKAVNMITRHIDRTGYQDAGKEILHKELKHIKDKLKDDFEALIDGK